MYKPSKWCQRVVCSVVHWWRGFGSLRGCGCPLDTSIHSSCLSWWWWCCQTPPLGLSRSVAISTPGGGGFARDRLSLQSFWHHSQLSSLVVFVSFHSIMPQVATNLGPVTDLRAFPSCWEKGRISSPEVSKKRSLSENCWRFLTPTTHLRLVFWRG